MFSKKMIAVSVFVAALSGCVSNPITSSTGFNSLLNQYATGDFIHARVVAKSKNSNKLGLILQGWSEFNLANYDQAEEVFAKIRKKHPTDLDGYMGAAWVATKRGQYEEAEAWLKKGKRWMDDYQKFMVSDLQGWMALNQGDLDAAEKHFLKVKQHLRADYPNRQYYPVPQSLFDSWDATPYVSLGWLAIKRGEWEKAKQTFETGLQKNADCFHCRDALARIALQNDDPNLALQEVLKGLESTKGKHPGLNGLLDSVLVKLNDADISLNTYAQLQQQYPDRPIYPLGLGTLKINLGQREEGQAILKTLLEQKNLDQNVVLSARYTLAWSFYFAKDNESAKREFEAYFANGGESAHAQRGYGFTLFRLGEYKKAHQELNAVKEKYPTVAQTPVTEAIPVPGTKITRTITYNVYSTLAWNAYLLGDFRSAYKRFRPLLKDYPNWVDVQTGMGFILWKLGKNQQAKQHFQKALSLYPNYPDALQGLALVQ